MTEFERKVAVWQFGQIGRLLGSRETIRQGGNDPVQQWEDEMRGCYKLSHFSERETSGRLVEQRLGETAKV